MSGLHRILGNEQIKAYFENVIAQRQPAHAYLLAGQPGMGRRTAADAVAMTLQCEAHGPQPCGECRSCRQFLAGTHPDVKVVTHEKPGVISVDEIRRQVVSDAAIRPYYGPYKIYIVPQAEKMNQQAQNALLKTLEEPPAYAVVFLLASGAQTLLPTIRSRCVSFTMAPLPDDVVRAELIRRGVREEEAALAAALARGNLGQAIETASSEKAAGMQALIIGLLRDVKDRSIASLQEEVRAMREHGYDADACLDRIALFIRDALMYKATKDVNLLVMKEELRLIRRYADKVSFEGLEEILQALERARDRLHANVNFDLTMEMLILTVRDKL